MLERWARVAEELGFDLLMVSDHVAVTDDVAAQYPAPFYEPFTTLSWLAGITRRIRLGTTVMIVPYRHPLLTARMATNLDRLSGGRLVLGVGIGWARQEFAALGVPFTQRGSRTDDHLAAMRAYFAADVAEYSGRYTQFAGVHTGPRPETAGGPPIWVGGNSDAGIGRAVRFGNAWHPLGFTMPWLRAALPRLAAAAQAADRPVPGLAPRIKLTVRETSTGGAGTDTDRPAGQGTLAQIQDDLAELAALGAETVVLDPYDEDPQLTVEPQAAWAALEAVAEANPGFIG